LWTAWGTCLASGATTWLELLTAAFNKEIADKALPGAVRLAVRPPDGLAATPGSAGNYNWSGYAGTALWVDPQEQLVGVMMMQSPGAMRNYNRNLLRQLVYQAIPD